MKKNKVLLVGWDAADWKSILPLVERGRMPVMKKLIENGIMGNSATIDPPFSPMLWTSIATGKRADKHGILGFSEPRPDGQGIRPVSSLSRKTKAIWNILMQNGLKSNVVAWWPSNPVEPIDGMMVSNLFKNAEVNYERWAMPSHNVWPEDLHDLIAHLRVHPVELSSSHIMPFIPKLSEIDQMADHKPSIVGKLISEALSVQAAATWALENKPWDFAAVYFDSIDHFCHGFMPFDPPKSKWIREDEYNRYHNVVTAAYEMMDIMLGHLVNLAGSDATVIVVSDHGFKSGTDRSPYTPFEPAGPAFHHRDHGILCISGPGIKKDERIYGACLLDITPTILSLFDLPVGKDMDGTPLVQICENAPSIHVIDSWDLVEGECGMLLTEGDENPAESAAAIRQLIELGYIEDPGDNVKEAVEKTSLELDYNLARVYLSNGRIIEAEPLLRKVAAKYSSEGRVMLRWVDCLRDLNQVEEARNQLIIFKKEAKDFIEKCKQNDIEQQIKNKGEKLDRHHPLIRDFRKMNQCKRDLQASQISEARLLLAEGKEKKAADLLLKINKTVANSYSASLLQAKILFNKKQYLEAQKLYMHLADHFPENIDILNGLAATHLKLRKWEQAAETALDAINIIYYNPSAHYTLGRALMRLKDYQHASMALETAFRMNPGIGKVKKMLVTLFEKHQINPEKAAFYKNYTMNENETALQIPKKANEYQSNVVSRISKKPEESVILVSGLPRSGTSLVMQMLYAGGVSILTDQKREADENNPKGYFEYDDVKRSALNNAWVDQAQGKAVKVVSHLLKSMPSRLHYKVIFVLRDIKEVIQSQQKMTGKDHLPYPLLLETQYKKHLTKISKWLSSVKYFEVLYIHHSEIIQNPNKAAATIHHFLQLPLDTKKMSAVVDKSLYRNVNSEKTI